MPKGRLVLDDPYATTTAEFCNEILWARQRTLRRWGGVYFAAELHPCNRPKPHAHIFSLKLARNQTAKSNGTA